MGLIAEKSECFLSAVLCAMLLASVSENAVHAVVRLAGGNAAHEGRVEIFYRCNWGTICNHDWRIEEANVVCRQLGYTSATDAWRDAHFGPGSGPILLADVRCRGSESSIEQCDHDGWYNHGCGFHDYDVGVTCNDTLDNPVTVRLTNGSNSFDGRVEINHNGEWGTICDDGWSIEDANVVCRRLGYPPASQAWQGSHFGEGSGPILLSNVTCNGTESNIHLCEHSGWFNHSCSHAEDAGVTCGEQLIVNTSSPVLVRLVGGNTPNQGRVEVYYGCNWGTVCDDGWSIEDANVICRQLGYSSAYQAWRYAHFGQGSGLILLDDVACTGHEYSIDQCNHRGWFLHNCYHGEDAGVTCLVTIASPIPVRLADGNAPNEGRVELFYECNWGTICSNNWSLKEANVICRQLGYSSASHVWRNAHFGEGSGPTRLDYVAFPVRLVKGATPYEGRVEVYYQNQWGTICSNGWGIEDANVICRQLGYPSASPTPQNAYFGKGSGLILLDSVGCNGTESSIDQCDHSGWLNNNCDHSQDVGVTCDFLNPLTVSVRLVNGDAPNEGRVEVYYRGQWGSICGSNWRIEEANVVCRQVGYPSASQAWVDAHFGQGSGPILLENVACDGHESNIDQCDHSGWDSHYCNHYYDVGVTCDLTIPTPVLVRLVDGSTPYEGRVELYYQCYWGTISDHHWTIEDANVICRQLGYSSAMQALGYAHFGPGSGLIVLSNVECDGYESSIDRCDHNGWYAANDYYGYPDYDRWNDVGVVCNVTLPFLPVLVRLANGSNPYEGRVEVYYQDQWGTICDDGWNIEDANVICRQLGLPPASQAWRGAHFGQESGPILLSNVTCIGNESSIDQCEHNEWFSHNCNPADDVGVTCGESRNITTRAPVSVRLVDGGTSHEGIVQVYDQCQWGSISSYQWSIKEANVVCRQLGYPSASQAKMYDFYSQRIGLVLLTNVACIGNESKIDQCDYTSIFDDTDHYYYDDIIVGATCNPTTLPPVLVRLADGNTPHEGRVEVYYKCQWGTICQSNWETGWNIKGANVICRQLGYPSASQTWRNAHFGQGTGPILLANVKCDGDESNIDQCDHAGWFIQYCDTHDNDFGVTCDVAAFSPVLVRLADSSNPNEGRVEVYYQDHWGTICDDGWNIEDANVICRQLGLPPASLAWRGAHFGQGSGPIVLSNVTCNGSESSIEQCDHSGWLHNSCTHEDDAGVTCGDNNMNATSEPVRLVNGNMPNEGRVEVYYKCFWGTICHSGWSIRDADVICRQLGYPSASQAWWNAHFGRGSGPILLNDVACKGTEESIDQCEHSGWFNHQQCPHSNDAGVTCNTDVDATFPPLDTEPPVITCPARLTVETDSGQNFATVSLPAAASVSDNSDVVAVFIKLDGSAQNYNYQANDDVILSLLGSPHLLHYTAFDDFNNWASCDMYIEIVDHEPPEVLGCPDDVIIPVISSSNQASHRWTPPMTSDNSNTEVDVTFTCQVPPPGECYQAGQGTFPVGVSMVRYTARDQSGNENICKFCITVTGQCETEKYAGLTWPVTSAGSTAKSLERCPLDTINAGEPRAVRNCSVVEPPVYVQWEEHEPRSCGENRDEVTFADVEQVEVSTGNVVEVVKFLASQTSASSEDSEDVEAVSNILANIVGAGSGDTEVTELVLKTVSNVIMSVGKTPDSQTPDINAGNSSAIIQSVEHQVSLTLRQEGKLSIRQDTIHVEAVSVDPTLAQNGLSFVSVRHPGQGSPQEGSLVGTEVQTFMDSNNIPLGIDVLASVQLPGKIIDSIESSDSDSSAQLQASFLIYADDTLFQSTLIRENRGENNLTRKVAGYVVSLTVENAELVNLTKPVVIKFKAPDHTTNEELETIQCVSWDFELEDGVGDWSPAGCARTQLPNEQVSCNCDHATNFAILVDVKGQVPDGIYNAPAQKALDIISQVGCALSIIALAITLIIYLAIRKLRSGKSRQIFVHFCFSLFMLYIVFLAGVDNAKVSGCAFVAALLHYLTLSTMMWMAVEARNMYVSTVKVFPEDTPRYMLKACLIAWGSPLFGLTITLAAASHHYGNEHYCFLEPGLVLYLGLLAPIGLILIHNIITFILVMRSLVNVREASHSQQISKRLQNAVAISALMGLTWCFGFLAIEGATFAFQLIFCLTNSLQGLVVFFMFCVRREEVRSGIAPYFSRFRYRLEITSPAKSNDTEMISRSAVPTSISSIKTFSSDVSITGTQ
ncbi:deleted in malignant brain tumors 1 protein-like [Patiria miniata]|uniref:Deleted in malignant brain tumors 1 protein n=1 Tax=Patiria miniata TaxID=46514 RepID=A0A913ZKS0_PATMI|nr:deleted in malignant brain tumors 1 protein-like [Patiria miniata]